MTLTPAQWIALAVILAVVIVLIAYSFTSPRVPTRLERQIRQANAEADRNREQRNGGQS